MRSIGQRVRVQVRVRVMPLHATGDEDWAVSRER